MSPQPSPGRACTISSTALPFVDRHIGPRADELATMLAAVGVASLDELADRALPAAIRDRDDEPPARPSRPRPPRPRRSPSCGRWRTATRVTVPMIGLGYSGTVTPPAIRRNVLENPAWYTAYTPYQPEISQGRLEALLTFQTTVADLTGLPVAGASLLDEATAAAEAMTLLRRAGKARRPPGSSSTRTRCRRRSRCCAPAPSRWASSWSSPTSDDGLPDGELFGLLLSYPGASGAVRDPSALIDEVHARGGLVAVAADLLALTLLTPPGELGADAVGRHLAAVRGAAGLRRAARRLPVRAPERSPGSCPGRLVGLSRDADGNPALRLALQTREQHIRREKATSNICTAQVLLAVVAACYAVYHGPDGLRRIALRCHRMAAVLAAGLRAAGVEVVHGAFFDTVQARVPGRADAVRRGRARRAGSRCAGWTPTPSGSPAPS